MPELDHLFKKLKNQKASDLHLLVGNPIKMRIDGDLESVSKKPMTSRKLTKILQELVSKEQWSQFLSNHELDFSYALPDVMRLRGSYFMTEQGLGAVFRIIPEHIPSIKTLGIPKAVTKFSNLESGLVLVTGPTGSGKSTTLAALIDLINTNQSKHIILIEDPTEYVHHDKKSFLAQREVGTHTASFSRAIRGAMRQDPDVILVGEIRDEETMSLTLEAAEKGVLVLGTLHTNGAARAVARVIDLFPASRQLAAKLALANSLRGVVSQLLVRKASGKGRIAIHEILIADRAVTNLVRTGDNNKLHSAIQLGKKIGMKTMDDALEAALKEELITGETVYAKATDKQRFNKYSPDELTI